MPEGDTIWLTAHRLREALAGQVLVTCDLRVPRLATAADGDPLGGAEHSPYLPGRPAPPPLRAAVDLPGAVHPQMRVEFAVYGI